LSRLITDTLGSDSWLINLDELAGLLQHVQDEAFLKRWQQVKQANKERLAGLIRELCSIQINPQALFDVQVKRIHEYKRQFMNILGYPILVPATDHSG
jgi:starch phosphorylase